ncbi:hypothetical protein FisN_19Hh111 [Fistulifera solaris]|uniref:Uncharacterized protein n=1 Tax=Fistulifera solaris TaxID=1519565 RepID=A0A1Z5JZT0_FISSO|nr:hypothetical protein FisN_19Hh111 [Fistulifera solaris]|eukprot:GAX19534.1 hypothetical protein FisN_19Hh111 [Fistulifera solaris]
MTTDNNQADPPKRSVDEDDVTSSSPTAKKNKRDWLSFTGRRWTRIGDDFQAVNLPEPITKPIVEDSPPRDSNT